MVKSQGEDWALDPSAAPGERAAWRRTLHYEAPILYAACCLVGRCLDERLAWVRVCPLMAPTRAGFPVWGHSPTGGPGPRPAFSLALHRDAGTGVF